MERKECWKTGYNLWKADRGTDWKWLSYNLWQLLWICYWYQGTVWSVFFKFIVTEDIAGGGAPYIGHIQLKQLTPALINKAYSDLLKTRVSKATVYQYHLFIHSVLAMAFKESIIPRNYASSATPPKRDSKPVQALSEDDINSFFNALYSDDKHYM